MVEFSHSYNGLITKATNKSVSSFWLLATKKDDNSSQSLARNRCYPLNLSSK